MEGRAQPVIEVTTRTRNGAVEVCIRDNGRGIPEAEQGRVFDIRFSTGEGRVKMGSGLAVAYSIVKQHLGELHLHSEAGAGTEVVVELPVRPAAAPEQRGV